jgi:gas vesicle protein
MGRIASFLLGGATGVVIGLLIAPRPGEETRAIVADKVDEYWGKGQDFYAQGVTRVQQGVSNIQPTLTQKGDELRDKIEGARSLIADQVAKNAAAARDVINDKIPVAAERISSAVSEARTQIDNAASALRGRTTELVSEEPTAAEPAVAAAPAAGKPVAPDSIFTDAAPAAGAADTAPAPAN